MKLLLGMMILGALSASVLAQADDAASGPSTGICTIAKDPTPYNTGTCYQLLVDTKVERYYGHATPVPNTNGQIECTADAYAQARADADKDAKKLDARNVCVYLGGFTPAD